MATSIREFRSGAGEPMAIIGIAAGETFFAKHLVPKGIEGFAEVERVESGSTKITPRADVIAVVEGLHESRRGAKHIRCLRPDRKAEGARGLKLIQPTAWPRLRAALRHVGVPTCHAPGGFDTAALVYNDELAVPDYAMSGAHGWIVRRTDIGRHLASLPPIQDSGEIRVFWIRSYGTGDGWNVGVLGSEPSEEERRREVTQYDPASDCRLPTNQRFFRVEYDTGSRIVKTIRDMESGEGLESAPWTSSPAPRNLEVGRRLPTHLVV